MNLIVAADKNWGIGKDNKLLVSIPSDMKFFRQETMGKVVVMGRKTLESLPGGKPLPNRKNIILSRDRSFSAEGCFVCHSVEALLNLCGNDDVMVMGGAAIYQQLLPYCDSCYITKIDCAFDADAYMIDLDERDDFRLAWQSGWMEEKGISYQFTRYDRINI